MSLIKSSKLLALILFLALPCVSKAQNALESPSEHIIQLGESLYTIALKHDVPMSDLAKWNNLSLDALLSVGKKLILRRPTTGGKGLEPVQYSSSKQTSKSANPPSNTYKKQSEGFHVVRSQETIEGISKLYGYSPENFRKMNGLRDKEVVVVGTKLRTVPKQ